MRRTKINTQRSLIALSVIGAFALTACGGDDAAEEIAEEAGEVKLVNDGEFTVCTQFPYVPFEYEEDGEAKGFDMDLAREFADALGVEMTVMSTAFEGISSGQDLASGKCDMGAGAITITDERKEAMLFSDSYFEAQQALLTKAGSGIASMEDLDGKKLGVQAGTTGAIYAEENAGGAELVSFEDIAGQQNAVKSGAIDAAINDNVPLIMFTKDNEGMEVSAEFETGESYGFAFALESDDLKEVVDAKLAQMKDDGSYQELYDSYFATN